MTSADVVVVGGGILGCSTALHLLEAGAGDVLLLERDALAQGTSNAGAGFLAVWAAGHAADAWSAEEAAIERYALDFYGALGGEADIGFRRDGVMWLATSEEAFAEHLSIMAGLDLVPDMEVLDPDAIESVTGGVVPAAGVHAAVFHPSAGRVSAPAATRAVAARFAAGGGRVEERLPVRRLILDGARAVGVETARGPIAAGTVVLAAGAWANELLRPLGARAPLVPLVAGRIVTEPLGVHSSLPALLVPELSFLWVREERGGLLFGCSFEGAPRYAFAAAAPPDRLAELPLDGIFETRRCAERAAAAIPALGRYESMTVAYGAPCYTPDLRGLVGPVPGVEGLYFVGGCNEAGLTHGPGYGRLAAELIVNGRTTLTAAEPFRLDRFGERFPDGPAVVEGLAARGRLSWVEVTR